MFLAMKGIHMITIAATIVMYFVRGFMLLRNSPTLDSALIRRSPYLIDTLLIISALWTAALMNWYPFMNPWVTAKFLGTLAFLGFVHAGFPKHRKLIYGLALIPLIYVLAVVVCLDPLACFSG